MEKVIKRESQIIKFDKWVNEKVGGNYDETISRQDAKGVQQRRPELNDDQAMLVGHLNIFSSLAFLFIGMKLIKNNPELGVTSMAIGASLGGRAIVDWHVGKGK